MPIATHPHITCVIGTTHICHRDTHTHTHTHNHSSFVAPLPAPVCTSCQPLEKQGPVLLPVEHGEEDSDATPNQEKGAGNEHEGVGVGVYQEGVDDV